MAVLDGNAPGLGDLVGVRRAQGDQIGDGAQGSQLLHRLVGGTVLADADAVVGEDPDGAQVGEGGETNGRAHVVGEDHEGGAVGDDPAVVGHAVDQGAHGVLAHAEVEVAPFRAVSRKGGEVIQPGIVGGGQVGRTADQLGQDCGEGIEHLAGGGTGGEAFLVSGEDGQGSLPVRRQLPSQAAFQLGGQVRVGEAVGIQLLLPSGLPTCAVIQRLAEESQGFV